MRIRTIALIVFLVALGLALAGVQGVGPGIGHILNVAGHLIADIYNWAVGNKK